MESTTPPGRKQTTELQSSTPLATFNVESPTTFNTESTTPPGRKQTTELESDTPLAAFNVESPTTFDMEPPATFNTESPATPPRRKQATVESSTPLAKGTASHQSHHEQNTQAEYAPYLQQDLTLKDDLELEDFLSEVFTGVDQDLAAVREVASNTEVKRLLNMFSDQVQSPNETHRYQPFTELANAAMTALRKRTARVQPESFVFCRNDPTYVAGSHAERKPDVVGVWERALVDVDGRLSVNNLCDKGPSEAPFAWHELLMFVEFKVKETKTAQTKPPSSHNTLADNRTTVGKLKLQAPMMWITTRSKEKAPSPLHDGGVITGQRIKAINPAVTAASNDPSPLPVPDLGGTDVLKSSEQAPAPKNTTSLFTQCASYALEMMSHGGIRHHAFGALIVGSNITLQYYSHSIILYSKPFNIVDDFAQFLSVLLLLTSLGRQGWGFADLVPAPPSRTPRWIFDKRTPYLSLYQGVHYQLGGLTFVLGDILHQQHGIIGRGTCVIGAKSTQEVEAVVKFSWRESERTPENVFIEQALRRAPPREDDNSIARHLPSILGHKTDDGWMTLGARCEPRHLQIMAFAKLTPITHITNVNDLAEAYRGIFKCYKWLYNEAHILHRDISLNNLMYYRDNDKIYGVLNDFDLSHQMTGEHPHPQPASTKQRTGTLPFMAIDFLHDTPMIHGYRHDLESVMWVMLFHIGQYRDGKSVGPSGPYHKWLLDNRASLLNHKIAIRDMVHDAQAQPAFQPLLLWINKMITMFDKAGRAYRDHKRDPESKFHVESSGGCITLDGFEAILVM